MRTLSIFHSSPRHEPAENTVRSGYRKNPLSDNRPASSPDNHHRHRQPLLSSTTNIDATADHQPNPNRRHLVGTHGTRGRSAKTNAKVITTGTPGSWSMDSRRFSSVIEEISSWGWVGRRVDGETARASHRETPFGRPLFLVALCAIGCVKIMVVGCKNRR